MPENSIQFRNNMFFYMSLHGKFLAQKTQAPTDATITQGSQCTVGMHCFVIYFESPSTQSIIRIEL